MGLQRTLVRPASRLIWLYQLWIVILLLLSASGTSGQILTLTPSLSTSERYDDNIFQTSSNKADDFITVVTPEIRLQYVPTRDTTLDFDYSASFEVFAKHAGQNQVSQRGLLRFVSPLTPIFSLHLRDTLIITEEPRDRVLEIDEVTGLRPVSEARRGRTLNNSASGSLGVQLAPRATLKLLFESLINDVNVPEEVDEFRYRVGAELGYLIAIARGSIVSVSYDVTFHTFKENAPVAPGAKLADFQVHTVSTGFRHDFSPTLSGNATIGYAVTASDDPNQDNNTGIVANVSITKTLRTGQAAFGYRRQFTSGSGTGGSLIADTFIVAFSSTITPKVTASLSSNLSLYDVQKTTGRDLLFWTMRPSLTYQILRFWSLSVAYTYELTDFNDPDVAGWHDHRLTFTSRFALREQLFLSLTYRYASRRLDEVTIARGVEEFDRNEIMLTLTFAPTFRF